MTSPSEKSKVTASLVKELRQMTEAPIIECKRALEEADGRLETALAILRERGMAAAQKRAQREARQGAVDAYIHPDGRIGALVELNCETDFVARTDTFQTLLHDLALQVAATSPLYLSREELPADSDGDPKELCLLEQPFIKDPSRTIQDIIVEAIAKTGENIRVRRFARFELGR